MSSEGRLSYLENEKASAIYARRATGILHPTAADAGFPKEQMSKLYKAYAPVAGALDDFLEAAGPSRSAWCLAAPVWLNELARAPLQSD